MKDDKLKIVHQNPESKTTKLVSKNNSSDANLYAILSELPKPLASMKLTTAQKKWWYYFGLEFVKSKQISALDLMHLQNAAISMDARCKLIQVINDKNKTSKNGVEGWVQKFVSGATNVTGYQTMYEKATKQLDDVSAHFGLSIKDRKKLGATSEAGEGQLNMFEQMEMFLKQQTVNS